MDRKHKRILSIGVLAFGCIVLPFFIIFNLPPINESFFALPVAILASVIIFCTFIQIGLMFGELKY